MIDLNVKSRFGDYYDSLIPMIEKAKYISFDVFDTLLVRFVEPKDVFLMMERKLNIPDFSEKRARAESVAQQKKKKNLGLSEITLEEIYDEYLLSENATKKNIDTLISCEIETERQVLYRSPLIKEIYDLAVSLGKEIIAISDMYLSSDIILEFLRSHGIEVSSLFVSSEYQVGKHEGKLFDVVINILGCDPSEILHMGDNYNSDYVVPLKKGVVSFHIPKIKDFLCRDYRYNQSAISKMIGAEGNLFSSFVVSYLALFNITCHFPSIGAHFGAMYAGPLVTGYVIWLDEMLKTDPVRNIYLLTRDGFITEEVFKTLGLGGREKVFFSSRRLTLMLGIFSNFDENIVFLLKSVSDITLREVIDGLNLDIKDRDILLEDLKKHISIDTTLDTDKKRKKALEALKLSRDCFEKIAKIESELFLRYAFDRGFDPKLDAIVDCGWSLSSHKWMESFFQEKIPGYYVGTTKNYFHEEIKTFLFSSSDKEWTNIHKMGGVEFLELCFSSVEDQISRFELEDGRIVPVYAAKNRSYSYSRAPFIRSCNKETLTFSKNIQDFIKLFKIDEIKSTLFFLFESLVFSPSESEREELMKIPHDPGLVDQEFSFVSDFWSGHTRLDFLSIMNSATDEIFLENIYAFVLRRRADKGGFTHYMAMLKKGFSRRYVVGEILISEEASSENGSESTEVLKKIKNNHVKRKKLYRLSKSVRNYFFG